MLIGNKKLILHGDSLEIMKSIPNDSIDMVFTSPPYAERRKSSYGGTEEEKYVEWFLPFAQQIKRIIKPTGSFFLNIKPHTDKGERSLYVFDLVCALKRQLGFMFVDELCWTKNAFPGSLKGRFKNGFEPVYHFTKNSPNDIKFNPIACGTPMKAESIARTYRKQCGAPKNGSGMTGMNTQNIRNLEFARPSNVINVNNVSNQFSDKQAHPACVDYLTEALTINGWKTYKDISKGEKILSFNIQNNNLEWQIVENIINYECDSEIISIDGRHISMRLSPNHRCVIKTKKGFSFREASKLVKKDVIPVAADYKDKNNLPTFYDVNVAKLIGWFITKGYFQYYTNKKNEKRVVEAVITQSLSANEQYVNEIEQILINLKITFRKHIRSRPFTYNKNKLSVEVNFAIKDGYKDFLFNLLGANKNLPTNILSWDKNSLFNLFLCMIKGDGSFRKKCFSFKQDNVATLDVIQAIGTMLGYDSYINYKYKYIEFTSKKHKLLRNSKNSLIQKIHYNGIMWCPVVSNNQTFVARRNGHVFITGNTFPEGLVDFFVKSFTNEGDVVLDPFAGSGTTGLSCLDNGRDFILIEKEEEYYNLMKKRLGRAILQ